MEIHFPHRQFIWLHIKFRIEKTLIIGTYTIDTFPPQYAHRCPDLKICKCQCQEPYIIKEIFIHMKLSVL